MRKAKRDVYVRLMGGLGNQMFQYAVARALAMRHDCGVRFDLTHFGADELRDYALDCYPVKAGFASAREVAAIGAVQPGAADKTGRGWVQLGRWLGFNKVPANIPVYEEPHWHFDPQLDAQKPPLALEGYWQSELYFKHIADILRAEFTPRAPLEPDNAALADEIAYCTSVSLHVRRGDYLATAEKRAFHGVCTAAYFKDAISRIVRHAPDARLFVFSEDHEWARANLPASVPLRFVTANPPERGFRDMQLMSLCNHHIVANSSFSWWGAWLNPSPEKQVIAPSPWFLDKQMNTSDYVPGGWVQLDGALE